VNKSLDELPSTSTSETNSTLVGNPTDAPRRRPTRSSSPASLSSPRIPEVNYRRESGTGEGNGKRLAVATRATILTTGLVGSDRDEGAVDASVTERARTEALGGGTS